MRTRLLLLMAVMLTAACRLSDRQQVGVLKFAATTITSATTAPATASVDPVQKQKPAMTCAQHRLQHIHSRVQRMMTRVIRFEMIASERPCPKARQSVVRS